MNVNLMNLFRNAKKNRVVWDKRWDDCRKYVMPIDDNDVANLFDATASDCVEILASSLFSLMTPAESFWVSLVAEDNENPVLVENVKNAENLFRKHLNLSNFYIVAHQAYLSLISLGTACIFFKEEKIGAKSAFAFQSIPMENVYLAMDSFGNQKAIFYKSSLRLDELKSRYQDFVLPKELDDKLKSNPDFFVPIVQSVLLDSDSGFPFVAFIDSDDCSECSGLDISALILENGKFETNPFIIFRWSSLAGEVYGRSPIMKCLPDIKTANKVVELILKNATIAISGIWQADDDGVLNMANIKLVPGSIIPKAVGSAGLTPLKSGADFDVSQIILSDLRARIRSAMFSDRLSILSEKVMTATEVVARNTEMMRILGATYGRLLYEFIRPLIERGLYILQRRGEINPVMFGHGGANLRYVAPISKMVGDEQASVVISWISAVDSIGCSDFVDKEKTVEWLANSLNVPEGLLKKEV